MGSCLEFENMNLTWARALGPVAFTRTNDFSLAKYSIISQLYPQQQSSIRQAVWWLLLCAFTLSWSYRCSNSCSSNAARFLVQPSRGWARELHSKSSCKEDDETFLFCSFSTLNCKDMAVRLQLLPCADNQCCIIWRLKPRKHSTHICNFKLNTLKVLFCSAFSWKKNAFHAGELHIHPTGNALPKCPMVYCRHTSPRKKALGFLENPRIMPHSKWCMKDMQKSEV